MLLSVHGTMVVERQAPGVRVARFVRPDLRDHLYDHPESERCRLFQDLRASLLTDLRPDETLVLNLGLVHPFTTEMYKCLLKVREIAGRRRGRVILCGLTPETQEILDLFQAYRLFELAGNEAEALRMAAGEGVGPGLADQHPAAPLGECRPVDRP
jgi:hypothetical protein